VDRHTDDQSRYGRNWRMRAETNPDANDKSQLALATRVQIMGHDGYNRLSNSSYWACEPIQNQKTCSSSRSANAR
jgi:hypothetical protein